MPALDRPDRSADDPASRLDVLRATFRHIEGIGPWTEAELWKAGVHDWARFRERRWVSGISAERKSRYDAELAVGEDALRERRAEYFAYRLPPSEHWRLYREFRRETAFLDIETTGLSPYGSDVTVVTVHGGGATRTFVRGEDLDELPAYLHPFALLVTFNGTFFDVPFLRTSFPSWMPPPGHVDLRFALKRLGYRGGLKRIEAELGLGDRAGVEGIHGADAVRLWYDGERGNEAARALLVEYNRADTVNLEPLLDFAVEGLTRGLVRQGLVRPLEHFAAP
jgi:uncharacterized protein YprB with RNaseH-like and TPR domain